MGKPKKEINVIVRVLNTPSDRCLEDVVKYILMRSKGK